jgi:hypothetical protein
VAPEKAAPIVPLHERPGPEAEPLQGVVQVVGGDWSSQKWSPFLSATTPIVRRDSRPESTVKNSSRHSKRHFRTSSYAPMNT